MKIFKFDPLYLILVAAGIYTFGAIFKFHLEDEIETFLLENPAEAAAVHQHCQNSRNATRCVDRAVVKIIR